MLPSVDSQQRPELSNHRILIRVRPHLERSRFRVLDQPGPPAALDPRQFRIHQLLQTVHASVRLIDGGAQLPTRWLAAAGRLGGQVLPEEGVVDVSAAVEVDERLQGDLRRRVGRGGGGGELLGEGVVGVYVGLVMLAVVELHDLTGDGGLESAIVICRGIRF